MKWGTWLRAEWDRVAGYGLVGLGALLVLLGYLGVRNTPFVAEQMAYLASGGIGGLFCLGFGVGLLLTADLHDEWRKLDRIEAELRGDAVPEPDLVALPAKPADPGAESSSGEGRHRRGPVPQPAGRAGALAVAPPHPVGGTRSALGVVSLLLLVPLMIAGAGWRRASQTADLDVATRGLGLAVAGVAIGFVVVAGWALWMRVGVLRRRAVVTLAVRRATRSRVTVIEAADPGPMIEDDTVFVASGHARFHRVGCPMLDWLEAVPVPRNRIEPGLSACGLCTGE